MESLQSLVQKNSQYHMNHNVFEEDVKTANELINLIERSRSRNIPMPGDIIVCCGAKVKYTRGHLESWFGEKYNSICTHPMTPFAFKSSRYDIGVAFDTSGGYWLSDPDINNYVLKQVDQPKTFCSWGWCGPCAGGAFNFTAKVNSWWLNSDKIH